MAEPKVPSELREVCGAGHLIVCVGPELSSSAGLPSPAELALQLLEVAEGNGQARDAEGLRKRVREGRVAEALGLLRTQLGRAFEREIEVRLCDQGQAVPELARSIAALRHELRAVYTTALDRLVERAFGGAWPSFADARPDLAQRRAVIFKLRGTLEFVQSWVLTREQHECELSPRSLRQAIFEAAYKAHRIMFVGFDPDDETLTRLLDTIPGTGDAAQGPSHFIVLPSCEPHDREGFERRGLHVILAAGIDVLRELGGDKEVEVGRREVAISGSPYLGLDPFSRDDAELFFGRQAEVSQAASRLGGLDRVHRRWLSVEGPSGVGKSSFVRAGVVPALERGFAAGTPARWRVATMRPGARPTQQLAAALHEALELEGSTSTLHDDLLRSRRALSECIERRCVGSGMLLIVDQLEEVIVHASESERSAFDGLLCHALERGALYLVTTIRTDFVPAFQTVMHGLAGMLNEHAERYALPPISRVGLREAIAAPAELLGVEVEAALVERLVSDAEALGAGAVEAEGDGQVRTRPSTLPLVAHVLRGLWTAGAHEDKIIELTEYEGLGGLSGALSRSADGLLAKLSENDRTRAKELLLRLVRVESDRADTRRPITREEAVTLAGEEVLLRLSGGSDLEDAPAARLVVVSTDAQQQTTVELVHEALLRHWDTLKGWIDENRGQLVLDAELARRASAWESQGRPRWKAPSGRELAGLLQGRPHGKNSDRHRAFQMALHRAAQLRRMGWLGVASVVAVVSLAFALVVLDRNSQIKEQKAEVEEQRAEAIRQRDRSRRSLAAQQGLRARALIPENAEREALLMAVQAVAEFAPDFEEQPPDEAVSGLLEVLADDPRLVAPDWTRTHDERVHAVALSSDGTRIATASADGTARIWDTLTGGRLATFKGHVDQVRAVGFSEDGERVATASYDGIARVWDVATQKHVAQFEGHTAPLTALAFCPDGSRVVTGSTDNTAQVWDATSGELIARMVGHERALVAVAFIDECRGVVTASLDHTAQRWDSETGRRVVAFEGHRGGVRTLAVSPSEDTLATGGDDSTVRLFDLDTGFTRRVLAGHHDRVTHVDFDGDGSHVVTASRDRTARVWLAETGEMLAIASGHERALAFVEISDDGSTFVSGSWDGDVAIWDVDTTVQHVKFPGVPQGVSSMAADLEHGRVFVGGWGGSVHAFTQPPEHGITRVQGHNGFVHSVAFSPDGKELLTAGQDGTTRIWGVADGNQHLLISEHTDDVMRAVYSADGRRIATVSSDGSARIWDAQTGKSIQTIVEHRAALDLLAYKDQLAASGAMNEIVVFDPVTRAELWLEGHTAPPRSLTFDEAGKRLATGSQDHTAIIWDTKSGKALQTFEGHDGDVEAVAFSPDGGVLVTASADATARIWDANDGSLVDVLRGHGDELTTLAMAPDGTWVATGSLDHMVRLWRIEDGTLLGVCKGHTGEIAALRRSPDGTRLVTGSHDGTARLWSTDACQPIAELAGQGGIIKAVAFSSDGTRVATASTASTIRVWDADSGSALLSLGDKVVYVDSDGSIVDPVPVPLAFAEGCERLSGLVDEDVRADLCLSPQSR